MLLEQKDVLGLLYLGLITELGIDLKARRALLNFLLAYNVFNTVEVEFLRPSFYYWYKTQQKAGTLPCDDLTVSPAFIYLASRIRGFSTLRIKPPFQA
jgi:hypothetical protein